MTLVVPDVGERRMLEYIVNRAQPTELTLRLYVNSVDLPAEAFSASDFTEASQAGYIAVQLPGANWAVSTNSGISVATYATGVAFNFATGADVYGYYVTDAGGNVMWAEEFPSAPFGLPSGGGQIVVRPQIQLN
jgi:hypothetical protein